MNVYNQSVLEVVKTLKTDKKKGLSHEEVKKRRKKFGSNDLPHAGQKLTTFKIFLNQWKSPLLWILLVAGGVSIFLHEYTDAIVILGTAVLNALVGFIQENKASRALSALQNLITYSARVVRAGKQQVISSAEIVVGDLLYLEAGDKIQADGRVVEATDVAVDESVLTGESEPIKKISGKIAGEVQIGDRKNMVFRGTSVVLGKTLILVTAIGAHTEIGRIATMVKDTKEGSTPLQVQFQKLSQAIAVIVIVALLVLFAVSWIFPSVNYTFFELFETVIAVSVAAIPEGLAISLTIVLAIGMQNILRRQALVRKLVAAETLGSVSVICTDKTGTLTEGKMSVSEFCNEQGCTRSLNEIQPAEARLALEIAMLANDATVEVRDEERLFLGDTTDTALLQAGERFGLHKKKLEESYPRISDVPFDSVKKYMASHHAPRGGVGEVIYVKGAPEVVLSLCRDIQQGEKVKHLTLSERRTLQGEINAMAERGLRVIAVAYRTVSVPTKKISVEDCANLLFVGCFGLSDPIRGDVKETLVVARRAGIRVVMITGDHKKTAQVIARELDIPAEDENVFEGSDLNGLSLSELQTVLKTVTVFARVQPADKIHIVQALRQSGEVVAMTGDGVNDAPALKGADIGVALGSGTDIAKEISDVVLLDNRFATIVAAVKEGRALYQNIQKVVLYLLAGSFAEVVLIAGSIVLNFPLAVLPVQILWINLIQDSFPSIALAFDPPSDRVMDEPPRVRRASIFNLEMKILLAVIMVVTNGLLFALFFSFFRDTGDIHLTRTIVFVGLGIFSLLYIYSVRTLDRMIWKINPFQNGYLTAAILFGVIMLLAAVYVPGLQRLLETVPLSLSHWYVILGLGIVNVIVIEIIKALFFLTHRRSVSGQR